MNLLEKNQHLAQAYQKTQNQAVVQKTIVAELKELMPKSVHFKHERDTAKTRTKKQLMDKRLKANNKKISDLLLALQRLNNVKGNPNETSSNPRRTETESAASEPVD